MTKRWRLRGKGYPTFHQAHVAAIAADVPLDQITGPWWDETDEQLYDVRLSEQERAMLLAVCAFAMLRVPADTFREGDMTLLGECWRALDRAKKVTDA